MAAAASGGACAPRRALAPRLPTPHYAANEQKGGKPMRSLTILRAAAIPAATVAALTPARSETITVTHWGSAFYGAPYAVAMAKGFFKKRGLDITGILTSAGGGTSVRNTL